MLSPSQETSQRGIEMKERAGTPQAQEATENTNQRSPCKTPENAPEANLLHTVQNAAAADTREKLKSRRTSLARALTSPGSVLGVVDMAKKEAELELPQSLKDFVADVFYKAADPVTQMLLVDGQLQQALEMLGHSTNIHSLRDICQRFDLALPEDHKVAEEENENAVSRGKASNGSSGRSTPSGSSSRRNSGNRTPSRPSFSKLMSMESSEEAEQKSELELGDFLAIVYSELIDQAESEDLAKAFGLFDRDGNGEIDMEEFETGLVALGHMNPMNEAGRAAFIAKIDVDGDDSLSAKELIRWLAEDTFDKFRSKAVTTSADVNVNI